MRASFSRHSGFTLLELSVVIVIIGLIVGGVVAGQTMLRASRVSSIMTDAQKYISATQSFRQKYGSLPGDMANATDYWGGAAGSAPYTTGCYATGSATSVATCNGNGDGQINYSGTYANESLRVWQHLANAGLIQGNYTGITGIIHTPGTNSPGSNITGGGFGLMWAGILSSDTYSFDGNYGHRLLFGGASSTYSLPVAAMLAGDEAKSLDAKYDDGSPALGSIRTWKRGQYGSTCATSTAVTATYDTTASSGPTCSLMILTGF